MRLVILGRDGVVNSAAALPICTPDEWFPIPGSLEAIARLNQANCRVTIASNQPGLAAGAFTLDDLNAIHAKLHQQLTRVGGHIDGIFFCGHAAGSGCKCHKPAPGLLWQILERFDMHARECVMIGDLPSDAAAARACGIPSLRVHSERSPAIDNVADSPAHETLAHAVASLLDNR